MNSLENSIIALLSANRHSEAAIAALRDISNTIVIHVHNKELRKNMHEALRNVECNLNLTIEYTNDALDFKDIPLSAEDITEDDINAALRMKHDANDLINKINHADYYLTRSVPQKAVLFYKAHAAATTIQCFWRTCLACRLSDAVATIKAREAFDAAMYSSPVHHGFHVPKKLANDAARAIQVCWHNHRINRKAEEEYRSNHLVWKRPDGSYASVHKDMEGPLTRIQACVRRWLVNYADDRATELYSPRYRPLATDTSFMTFGNIRRNMRWACTKQDDYGPMQRGINQLDMEQKNELRKLRDEMLEWHRSENTRKSDIAIGVLRAFDFTIDAPPQRPDTPIPVTSGVVSVLHDRGLKRKAPGRPPMPAGSPPPPPPPSPVHWPKPRKQAQPKRQRPRHIDTFLRRRRNPLKVDTTITSPAERTVIEAARTQHTMRAAQSAVVIAIAAAAAAQAAFDNAHGSIRAVKREREMWQFAITPAYATRSKRAKLFN